MMDTASPEVHAPTPPTSISSLQQASHEKDYTAPFSTVAALFRALKRHDGDFIIFQGVEADAFQQIKTARERRGSKIRFHYRPAQQRLLITVPKFPHEVANITLNLEIYRDLNSMGLTHHDLKPAAATEFVGGGGDISEPDACFMPPARRNDPAGWPTLVIETGCSQSLPSLRAKMNWWFSASDHAVKIVLLIKASPALRTICLEKYIKDVPQTRAGATNTRNMPGLAPQLRQTTTIAPQPGSNTVAYDVLGGPLVLEFSLIFLRPADAARGERDIMLSTPQLVSLAEDVWARV